MRTLLGDRLSRIDLSAQPAWVKDLRSIWDSTKEANEGALRTPVMEDEEEEEEEEDELAQPMWLTELLERYRPKSFEEVLGQDELVSTLSRRVITKDHSRHIVLHGPEGSGKTTVARLYAKALQCSEPTPTGSPCHRCDACTFGGGLNYIEIDAERYGNIEHARYLRVYLRGHLGALVGERSAIVVKNADRLSGSAADILLKAVEEYSGTTTFIFVLHEVSALQPALRSRAQAFRLLPLADEVALNHLASVCKEVPFRGPCARSHRSHLQSLRRSVSS